MSHAKPRKLTPRQEVSSADTATERLTELAQDSKLARLVAAHPNAPADLLLELSRRDDRTLRKTCTSNANTPVEALLKLGAQFPEQLLENPVFELLLLEHPGLFEELPTSTLNSLLKRDQVPAVLIRWAWKHRGESTLHSLLMNPNTPVDVVDELCKSSDEEIRIAAQLHCSRKLPKWASSIKGPSDLEKQQRVHDQLVFGSTRKWDDITQALFDLVCDELQERLIPIAPVDFRKAMARDDETPAEMLAQLAKDEDKDVRRKVAGNSQTPAEVLTQLAKDEDKDVRRKVAGNSQTPAEVLTLLAKDQDGGVRVGVAMNSNTPTEELTELAKDEDRYVRQWVAENSQTPAEVLTQLAKEEDGCFRGKVARNSQTPAEGLTQLAKDEDVYVREWVAENSQTPAEVIAQLAKDQDRDVRRAVVGNSQIPAEVLTLLAKDPEEKVRKAVVKNRNTPKPVVSELRETFLMQICADGCKGSQPSPGRRFLFTLPHCPPSLLAKNFRSRSWLERFAIAGNPSTPEAVLERMAKEGNQLVRRAATSNLARRASAPNRQLRQDQPIT